MSNPYGCPDHLYRMIVLSHSTSPVLLRAVARLGPKRVQWLGRAPQGHTAWALDGARAQDREILAAAGREFVAERELARVS